MGSVRRENRDRTDQNHGLSKDGPIKYKEFAKAQSKGLGTARGELAKLQSKAMKK